MSERRGQIRYITAILVVLFLKKQPLINICKLDEAFLKFFALFPIDLKGSKLVKEFAIVTYNFSKSSF